MKIQFEIKNRQVFFAIIFISFVTLLTLAIAITASNPGHTSNDVMISIDGVEKTLQSAINAFEIGTSIFSDGVDGSVAEKPSGWAKITIKGLSYVVPIHDFTPINVARVYTSGKIFEGHKLALDAYLCAQGDLYNYNADAICKGFGYSKGSTGNVGCGNAPLSQLVESRGNNRWYTTDLNACGGGGPSCNAFYHFIRYIDCKR